MKGERGSAAAFAQGPRPPPPGGRAASARARSANLRPFSHLRRVVSAGGFSPVRCRDLGVSEQARGPVHPGRGGAFPPGQAQVSLEGCRRRPRTACGPPGSRFCGVRGHRARRRKRWVQTGKILHRRPRPGGEGGGEGGRAGGSACRLVFTSRCVVTGRPLPARAGRASRRTAWHR